MGLAQGVSLVPFRAPERPAHEICNLVPAQDFHVDADEVMVHAVILQQAIVPFVNDGRNRLLSAQPFIQRAFRAS
jgi:hypothetical protein